MATTVTSSARLATHAALFDELGKIAEAQPGNSEKLKKWVKNSALVAAGAGAGTAATMIVDKFLGDKLGKTWQSTDPKTKMLIIGPLIGVSTMGAVMASRKLMAERKKAGE
jgi:hypothetical protein